MKVFKDKAGREWTVEVTGAAVKRVRGLMPGVDLLQVVEENCKLLARLADDPVFLVDVLYCVCKPQADAAGVDDVAFGEAMNGPAIFEAQKALYAEIADFFPDPQRGAAVRKVIEKTMRVADLMLGQAVAAVDAIDPSEVLNRWTTSSGVSPAPAGSTPAPTPSANS